MAAGDQREYSVSQYSAAKTLVVGWMDLNEASGLKFEIESGEDMYIDSWGALVTEQVSGTVAAVLTLQDSGTSLGTLTIPSGTAVGALLTATGLSNPTSISSGDYLGVTLTTTATNTGQVRVYINYHQQFLAG